MRSRLFSAVLVLAIAAGVSAPAAEASSIVFATGTGWCESPADSCSNSDTNVITNHYATPDFLGSEYRDWFAFDVPVLGVITSATLNVWSNAANTFNLPWDPAGQFDLYEAAGISFAGLLNGPALASIGAVAAHPAGDEYVSITFNALGLALLNGVMGSSVVFGGDASGVEGEYFGYSSGVPIAYLELEVGEVDPAPVPEPASLLLFGSGAVLVATAIRRRKRA